MVLAFFSALQAQAHVGRPPSAIRGNWTPPESACGAVRVVSRLAYYVWRTVGQDGDVIGASLAPVLSEKSADRVFA